MKSPFPGMDPFIEACGLWEVFHLHLVKAIGQALADQAPEQYLVRTGERSYVVFVEPEGKRRRPILPDVTVTTRRTKKDPTATGGAVVRQAAGETAAVAMRAYVAEEHREGFVEIFEADPEQRLVTTVEVLSPANKRPGTPGWELYQRKRQSVLQGGVNLVEIDLLPGGQRMPMLDPWPDSPYALLVARALRNLCDVVPVALEKPLPPLPVPLAKPDADARVDLGPMVQTIYQRYRYGRSIDYARPLTPPLPAKPAAWVKRLLRAHKSER
jgi:hypothetical protein